MNSYRIALANIKFPSSPEESVRFAQIAIDEAAEQKAQIICFPECFVPGYRGLGKSVPRPDAAFLESAWESVGKAAAKAKITVVLGSERVVRGGLVATAAVFDETGKLVGVQDKVQIDPTEDGLYTPGSSRRIFSAGRLTFGVSICHEGWRYPETVRWAARHGAQLVFHPHLHEAETGSFRPTKFADPANTFHEKAALCRAAENTIYFATVNYASQGSPTTSAVVKPDGTLLAYQPYGEAGLLVVDIDLDLATCFLAKRYAHLGDL